MKKKLLALGLTAAMSISLLAGCGGGDSTTTSTTKGSDSGAETTTTAAPEETTGGADGSVYYLNFKPEQDGQWQELAELYSEETGIEVKVITAASGQYETSLMSEMGKSEAPTLFQVNGPVGLANWKDYCYDLSGSKVAGELSDSSFALMDGDSMAGIAYVIETYGIIYNKGLLEKAGYTQDDITNFDSLKTVVEDITARKDELGFAAFTSAGMDGSSDWRFKTHLANLPIYYEYQDEGIGDTEAIKGTYLDNYRMIWDLYINNSTVEPTLLSAKTGDDATAEFVSEQAVFYQNGTWAYGDVADLGDENLGMLPIYIGVEGEEDQGLCTGTENYWCVNKDAAEEDIQATLDFMYWCVSSETGVQALCGGEGAMPSGETGMGFVIPFKSNLESANALINIASEYVAAGKKSVQWNFPTMPSENWKNGVGSALTAYAANQSDDTWNQVVEAFVDGWATEKAASAS
jgi:raffinose/stachyose/melibiose transport system substrate-binding protein